MSEGAYNPISQGPATIPMENWGDQRRITPPPQQWCNPRRTKIIIAIVILSLLWILSIVIWAVMKSKAEARLEDILNSHEYLSSYQR